MNSQVMKHLIGILLESPLYPTLSRRERHRLLNDFIGLYTFLAETPNNGGAGGSPCRREVRTCPPEHARQPAENGFFRRSR